MQDPEKVQQLVETICEVLDLADDLEIDVRKEVETLSAKILKLTSANDTADIGALRELLKRPPVRATQ
jgi:hypothetical protein